MEKNNFFHFYALFDRAAVFGGGHSLRSTTVDAIPGADIPI